MDENNKMYNFVINSKNILWYIIIIVTIVTVIVRRAHRQTRKKKCVAHVHIFLKGMELEKLTKIHRDATLVPVKVRKAWTVNHVLFFLLARIENYGHIVESDMYAEKVTLCTEKEFEYEFISRMHPDVSSCFNELRDMDTIQRDCYTSFDRMIRAFSETQSVVHIAKATKAIEAWYEWSMIREVCVMTCKSQCHNTTKERKHLRYSTHNPISTLVNVFSGRTLEITDDSIEMRTTVNKVVQFKNTRHGEVLIASNIDRKLTEYYYLKILRLMHKLGFDLLNPNTTADLLQYGFERI